MERLSILSISLVAGAFIALQGTINGTLSKQVGTMGAIFINVVINLTLALIIGFLIPSTFNLKNIQQVSPVYIFSGGILGVIILSSLMVLLPKIGPTLGFTLILFGQYVSSLLLEHYGAFGAVSIPISLPRILGVILVLSGALLFNWKS